MSFPGSTMRVLEPAPGVLAFYDGRIPGMRAWSSEPNWLDDGAFELGTATYALLQGAEALVYDTHISLAHAQRIRDELARRGAERITVVLSHWHLDHVAGNSVFADCPIIAHVLTDRLLREKREAIEAGTQSGPPAIAPLVLPTRTYDGERTLRVGDVEVVLRHADIHSRDGTVLWLPAQQLLLAGDTLEDTVTWVAEPDRLAEHRRDLARMAEWPVRRILPNHGDPDIIASGGYGPALVGATDRYVAKLLRAAEDNDLARLTLSAFVAEDLAAGTLRLFPPYEAVHRRNVDAVRRAAGRPTPAQG